MIGLGHALSLALATTGPSGQPWILANGAWTDTGLWDDTAVWKDS